MKGIIINADSDGILTGIGNEDLPPASVKDIEDFPMEFEGTQVTDYFLCVSGTLTSFPSERFESYVSKYHQKIENGIPVDYSQGSSSFKGAHIVFDELKVDHNKIQIEGFRKAGINPWISFRMNDVHYRERKTGPCLTEFYHAHPEDRRVPPGRGFLTTVYDRADDYAHPEIRERIFGMIEESLARYDPYGIELDFQRELRLFRYGMEYDGIEILNGFIREIDTLTHRFEKKYGHEIKFAVRVAPDIQTNFDFGLDVMQWVREGIVDMVIPAGRWSSNDNDMPIKLWHNLLKPYNVTLAPCIEMRLAPYPAAQMVWPNIETFAAFAASAYAQGADKIYIYNYFRSDITKHFDKSAPLNFDAEIGVNPLPGYFTVINSIGDPDTVQKMNRRHIVTYKDTQPVWENNGGIGRQLPAVISNTGAFKLFVGDIPEGAELTLRLGVKDIEKALAQPPLVCVNLEPCEFIGSEQDDRFALATVLCYSIPKAAYSNLLCPRVAVEETTEFTWVEVYVKVTD